MSTINVRDYGAVGDGKSDDTEAIRKATSALPEKGGVLFFPPGHYLSDTIEARDFTTYRGDSAWGYAESGGTMLSPLHPDQPCLIDANKRCGTRFVGLNLRGCWKRQNNETWKDAIKTTREEMHGIVSSHPGAGQNIVIDDCRIRFFTGSAVKLDGCGVWAIRHNLFMGNRLHGIDAHDSFDGWVIDNQIAGNGHDGLRVQASATITGNRIEHNCRHGILINSGYAQSLQITGNLFCANGWQAIEHDGDRAEAIAITGNTFRHSGRFADGDTDRDCHVRLVGMQGLSFTGNTFYGNEGDGAPSCVMILGRLKDSVVTGNALFQGATKELIRDEGGHENFIIANNPGSLLVKVDSL